MIWQFSLFTEKDCILFLCLFLAGSNCYIPYQVQEQVLSLQFMSLNSLERNDHCISYHHTLLGKHEKRKTSKWKTPLSWCSFCSFVGFLTLYEKVTLSQKRQSYILMLENRWECYVPTLPFIAVLWQMRGRTLWLQVGISKELDMFLYHFWYWNN